MPERHLFQTVVVPPLYSSGTVSRPNFLPKAARMIGRKLLPSTTNKIKPSTTGLTGRDDQKEFFLPLFPFTFFFTTFSSNFSEATILFRAAEVVIDG